MKQKHSKQAIKQRRSRLIVALFVLLVVVPVVGIGVLLSVSPTNFQSYSTQQPPDDFALTATTLIGQLTQNALILTDVANGLITLTPTPTLLPLDEVQDKWLDEVEQKLGFTHSEIEIAVGKLAEAFEQDLRQANREKLDVESHRYFADDRSFVAMMIRTVSITQPSLLFVFEQIDDEPHLLFDEQMLGYDDYFIGYQDEVFIDLNQSGNINLVYGSDEVWDDCRISKMTILEFTSDGIVDISPVSDEQPNENFSVFNIVDIDNDGLFEIEDPSPRVIIKSISEVCPINREPIYYQWDGERYSLADRMFK